MIKNNKNFIITMALVIFLFGIMYALTQRRTKPQSNTLPIDTSQSITIGALLPLSGKNEFYGNEIKNAIELAREEINEGGISGKNLQIIYEDDQADPKVGTNAMSKLVHIDKVPVVLGSWVSGVVLASAPLAESAGVIIMAEAIAPNITQAGDYIFRIQLSALQYTQELARQVIQKLTITKIAILYINNDFGVALRDTLEKEVEKIGVNIVSQESYSHGDQDFRSQLTKIKQANPGALFIGGYQEQQFIIKQAYELGIETLFLAGPPFENKSIIDNLGELAEGVIYPYHFDADTSNPKTIAYMKAYEKRWGVETGGFAPLMYDATYIIANALKHCGEDTWCIKAVLYNTVHEGVSGTISFDENGDPTLPVVIKTVKNGQFVRWVPN